VIRKTEATNTWLAARIKNKANYSMPHLPHNFHTLRQNGVGSYRPTVLMLGAGMSYGLVPGPGTLLAEKRASAEVKLGCTTTLPLSPSPPANHLYEWADEIRTQLIARGDRNPKLTLAQSLDIPSEPRWLGCVTTQRHTPRHRVIARFAREGLWDQIWSLNWDCVQESAFENVGIKRGGEDALLQWPTVFRSFVTAADCSGPGELHTVKVIKPHGCVMALVEAEVARKKGDNPQHCSALGLLAGADFIFVRHVFCATPGVGYMPAHEN